MAETVSTADPGEQASVQLASVPIQRAALVMVVMVAVHSMLEYPLWYSYFLLPAAFAFGLCLERPEAGVGIRFDASAAAVP